MKCGKYDCTVGTCSITCITKRISEPLPCEKAEATFSQMSFNFVQYTYQGKKHVLYSITNSVSTHKIFLIVEIEQVLILPTSIDYHGLETSVLKLTVYSL